MKAHRAPFNVWLIRIAALHCRRALLYTRGDHTEAARLVGCSQSSFSRWLARDNAILAERESALARQIGQAELGASTAHPQIMQAVHHGNRRDQLTN